MKVTRVFALAMSIAAVSIMLSACSSRFEPAPVVSLSTVAASAQNLTEITGNSYTVEAGDTLFAIAFYSGNDYRELAKLNNISPPYSLAIGQRIALVPEMSLSHTKNTSKIEPKIDPAHTVQRSDKIVIDPKDERAYGEVTPQNHRKNQNISPKNSRKSDSVKDTSSIIAEIKATSRPWIWPANGLRTLATVGSDGSKRGLDIKGKKGASVVAAAAGKVVYAGNALKGYGNLIIIKHDDQYLSAYAHNEAILVGEQTYVTQGQQIATMGNSGASDVMLHFEIRKRGKSVDPFRYLPQQ
mgnify:CR=1 FL=1